jgi:SHS2 domain-containing protein
MDVSRMRSRSVIVRHLLSRNLLVLYGRLHMGTFEVHPRPDGMGISARSSALPELFEAAAEGLVAAIVDATSIEHRAWVERAVTAETVPALMTAWLSDVLVLVNTVQFMPKTFVIDDLTGLRLRATVHGEPLDAARHRTIAATSAATVATDRVAHGAGGWSADVVVQFPAARRDR